MARTAATSSRRPPIATSATLRRGTEAVILVLIGGLLLSGVWGLAGRWPGAAVRPMRVVGPSMAPTPARRHFELRCLDCGYPFACAADDAADADRPIVCPNCGCAQPSPLAARPQPGDLLQVDTGAYRSARPRRWELVVFRSPLDLRNDCIKRVVGLPGETVEIRGGDVWIDGARIHKSLADERRLAVPVYDSRYRPRNSPHAPPRWRPVRDGNGWTAAGSGLSYRPPREGAGQQGATSAAGKPAGGHSIAWIEYVHWRRAAGHADQFESVPISDDVAYNRSTSRRLNDVADLLLVARVQTSGPGRLSLRATVGGRRFVAEFEPSRGTGRLLSEAGVVPGTEFALPGPLLAKPTTLEFSTVDHQVLLAVGGRLLVHYVRPPAEPTAPARESTRPLAIGAAGLRVQIEHLELLRDIYYTAPTGPGERYGIDRPFQLGSDEYFVLGDNSPVSSDSRTGWPGGGLPASARWVARRGRCRGWPVAPGSAKHPATLAKPAAHLRVDITSFRFRHS